MKEILKSIYPYAFFVLLLIIPFDEHVRALPNILLIILGVTFPFIITTKDLKKLYTPPAILFFVFIIYLFLNALFLDRVEENFPVIKKIMISVGVLLLYLPVNDFKKINSAIIFSALAAIVYSTYNILILIKDTGSFDFGNNQAPLDTLLIERLYLGLLCVFSILVSYRAMTKKFSLENKYYLANIFLNIIFIFLIVSRIAIITLIILAVLYLFYGKINTRKLVITFGGLAGVIALAFIFNHNIEKRFLFTTEYNESQALVDKIMLWEPRTKIWECSYIIFKDETNIWTGLGFKTTNDKLIDCYDVNIENEGRRKWFLHEKYNTHNQFIDFMLSTGILGFILFLALFLALFFKFRKEYFPTALLITIVLFSFVESLFHRQIGGYYFGIILIFLLLEKNRSRKLETNNNELPK